jgi:hypothetical protein
MQLSALGFIRLDEFDLMEFPFVRLNFESMSLNGGFNG